MVQFSCVKHFLYQVFKWRTSRSEPTSSHSICPEQGTSGCCHTSAASPGIQQTGDDWRILPLAKCYWQTWKRLMLHTPTGCCWKLYHTFFLSLRKSACYQFQQPPTWPLLRRLTCKFNHPLTNHFYPIRIRGELWGNLSNQTIQVLSAQWHSNAS